MSICIGHAGIGCGTFVSQLINYQNARIGE